MKRLLRSTAPTLAGFWHDLCVQSPIIPVQSLIAIGRMGKETMINPDVDRSPQTMPQALGDLRALAAWYREYAELAGNPSIWASRVMTAEDLEREASDLEQRLV